MANTPNIRFKGFADDWEQRKLGDTLCSLQNNTLSRAELTYEEGTIKNVHYGDILVKYGEVLDVKNEQIPNIIDTTVAEKYKASFLQNGDVIFADTAEDETVGKCSEIAGLTDETALSGLHTIPYRPQLKFATGYLGYYLNSSVFHQQLIPLMQGIKVTSISKSAMQNTDIVYPKSFDEQEKIGAYFMHLDHLITLHQRKFDEIKQLKKFMLQKMFPKNGDLIPEIRFVGFTGVWEQRKLGEVCTRVQGNDGRMELPTLTISAGNGWMRQEDRFSSNIAGKEQKNYTLLRKGELSYNHGNSKLAKYGAVFSLQTYEEALVPRVYHSFKVIKGNADFVEYYFATKLPDRELGKLISSGARMDGLLNIGYDEFMGIPLLFPTTEEQTRIAIYFRHLDYLITLHQHKCDQLKEVKRFMLQNMFPQKG